MLHSCENMITFATEAALHENLVYPENLCTLAEESCIKQLMHKKQKIRTPFLVKEDLDLKHLSQ